MSNEELSDTPGIAIIGMAARFPGARSVDEFWRNIRDGVESITFFADEELANADPSALTDPNFVKAGALLEGIELFDASFFDLSAIEAEITDPQHRIFLEAAHEALESAGYDPEKYDGAIGVYAGAGMNTYLIFNLAPNQELVRSVGALPLAIGNDKDYLVTRVSYKLNLGGPSINVQTSCSTSLVAVSLACQSLLDYQCDMALAGGVSLRIPQKTGYQYQEGSITSPDGHCRAFDAKARGTIFGEGLGIVVLKRLDEALEDGDQIYAVIRGSAVNNDGALKIGYTAPSVDGQVRVIAEALSASGIEPETISYVEAHGTGTPLGDPIEIAALKKAFGSGLKRRGFCAIGSVKTNVGHLDTAAGVAGLIKTTLALKHKLLPPTLHFEQPNPQIDFDNSPFYVNTRLHQWTNGSTPRRAGVSSFGIGGTNAHVILEEAPPREPSGASRPYQLLLLSAKTETALEAATDNLARYLREHADINLADVAYTLQLGRKSFSQRRFLVCRDREEAIAALETRDPARLLTHRAGAGEKPVVYMFSGQGSQHTQMGAELYRTEPVFRQTVDDCARLLKPLLGLDLREIIYPADEQQEEAARQLQQTFITQPALFVVEYALAQLWMKWGVRPQAMIGHSIGEYTAACLSGVFTLEQALALVATRGRMMQSLPTGAMLAVNLPPHEVEPLVGAQLSLAAVNSPSLCVVSGESAAVEELAERLTRREVNCRRLHTSHAFHSHMMEPVVGEFTRHVAKLKLKPPTIPYISNLTGNWIRADEATDPQYWARHLRQTVRFAEGLTRLAKEAGSILLEIGPGQTLGTLARTQTNGHVILSTLRHPHEAESDAQYLLKRLGQVWLSGGKIDWQGFYADEQRLRLPLPTYPFERKRYWIDAPRTTTAHASAAPSTQTTDEEAQTRTPAAASSADTTHIAHDAKDAPGAHRTAHERPVMGTPYVAPRDETEQKIAHIWETFLSVREVGVEDNFFELGGHSLLATQLIALLRDAFRLPLPLGSLFQSPTVAGLAQEIARLRRDSEEASTESPSHSSSFDALPKIVSDREHRYEPFPLTDIQQAYWVGRSSSLELGGVATHIYFEVEGRGIDVERLEGAWRRVIERHDMLRAIVLADGRQQVLESVPPYEIALSDFSELDAEEARPQLEAVRARMSHQVLPAERWPLFEIHASRLTGGRLRLHVSFDMLIGDAWSFQLLWRDLLTYYTDETAQLPELNVTFRDYVLTEAHLRDTALYEQAREYWWRRIDEMPAAPELPLARSPATLTHPQFVRRTARLEATKWEELKRRAGQAGLTPSGVLLAAYAEVLSLWSKRQHFMINLTLFNRLPMHEQIEQVVGDFTSLTLLEADYRVGGSFRERGRKLQEQLWEDIDRRYVSGVAVMRELARRRGAAQAVMPVIFTSELNFSNANDETPSQGTANEATTQAVQLEQVYSISQTPQVWIDHQASEVGGALVFNWDAVEELFPPDVLQQMFDSYCSLLERLAKDEKCWDDARVLELPPTQAARRAAYNETSAPLSDACLHQLFLQQAAQHPHRPALVSTQRCFTYAELERFTRRLAQRLRRGGARPNQLVGVVMQKGWEQTAAVLAVLRAGAAYLPISADLPRERIDYLLNHGEVDIVLTQHWIDERFEWPERIHTIAVTQFDDGQDAAPDDVELDTLQSEEDLAYVIYTSGSTGTPKGVMIDHRGAVNTILDINERFHLSAD
ncbi:MAG TPA: beta-ketoacyl synthase N-terminal-like domain-containing protein, partial [Pyrinomonadaceae bacterium]|nr:beta-ketoacyl synthase N-terminal-like domain-containing protein [Pyrinomonadaceae bacterium]